jgi:geranylgeranyl diphosphate synthase type II
MNRYIDLINEALDSYLPHSDDVVSQAMRYSVENGGKRIRPSLLLAFCDLCSGDINKALPLACALEMIHTYSLIHDDLPCMDDDDFRRGKPSCHVKFGYEYALLAGDALLTLAFETALKADLPANAVIAATKELAVASGWAGMVGGQVIDLQNEGKTVGVDQVVKMYNLKTGELIRAACVIGCIAAGATSKIPYATLFAHNIGLSFQIVDDILDIIGDSQMLGKPVGSDAENEKCTYVSIIGIEEAKKTVSALTKESKDILDKFDGDTQLLKNFAQSLENRNS